MKNKSNKSIIVKVARSMGNNSARNCYGWFNQPKVPASMKQEKK